MSFKCQLLCMSKENFSCRYGESRRSSGHMLNPWDVGMGPREVGHSSEYGAHASGTGGGGMSGHGGGSHLMGSLSHLSHMGNDKSKLALDLLNVVLSNVGRVKYLCYAWSYIL